MYVPPFTFALFNKTGPGQQYVHLSALNSHHVNMSCVRVKKLLFYQCFVDVSLES